LARIVLLADDSVTAQNMGRRIMTDAGYEVITVNNGSAALKKIHESHPDLIVLDVYMPGYGGLEVCQRLKESEATMKIPVLLTVGKMEPFKVDEAKRVRADGHIIKPFEASELLSALTKLEDKIVPQSENSRGRRGKAETRKSRTALIEDPAATFDDSHTEQIEYLARVKQRRQTDEVSAETMDSPVAGPAVDPTPATDEPVASAEVPAGMTSSSFEPEPVPQQETTREEDERAVTFASGPIYESAPRVPALAEQSVGEFEIQPEVEIEHRPEPVMDMSSSSGPSVAPADFDIPRGAEISVTETVAGLDIEPGLVPETPAGNLDSSPKAEPARRWIAENVVTTSEEAAHSLEEEMQQAHAVSEPAASEAQPNQDFAADTNPAPATEWQTESTPEIDSGSGAAFAAAASASESFAQTNAVGMGTNGSDSEPAGGSEASAAWDNWQRIRDTVITPRATEAVAESVSEMAQAAVSPQNDPPAAPPAQDAAPLPPASGSDALSNIVDSVLAELKPRLLAEIAKQLANEKK
jgi:CheY-like chemotaxis protein